MTFITIILAYPIAYFLAFRVTKNRMTWLILINLPFWTSYLLRVLGWKIMLGNNGIATVIFNGMGEVVAAISVCGPSNRLTEDVMEQIAADVMAAADSISATLGSNERPDSLVPGRTR